ncbi:MAG: hypothetical protein MR912_09965 [Prevotella sp.]|nr:hypothetical protein [Prevotella sp.]
MGRKEATSSQSDLTKIKPSTSMSDDAREQRMIKYATDLAEKQLREGTASAQVITHYLKLGSSRERLEQREKEQNIKLSEAKIESIRSEAKIESMFEDVVSALKRYSGSEDDE